MILDIALGIVLAYFILAVLPLLVAGGCLIVVIVATLGLIAVFISGWKTALVWASGLLAIAISVAVPYFIFQALGKWFPKFLAAMDGKPPFDGWRNVPIRILLFAPVIVGLVVLGFVLLALCVNQVEAFQLWLETNVNAFKT